MLVDLESDFEFLTAGVEVASGVYTKAIQVGKSSDQKLMELPWSVVEFEKLVEKCRNLQYEKCKHQKSYRIEIKPVNLSKRVVLKEAYCC